MWTMAKRSPKGAEGFTETLILTTETLPKGLPPVTTKMSYEVLQS